jgi:hypothetical protein
MELISCYLSKMQIEMINNFIRIFLQNINADLNCNIPREDAPIYFACYGYISNEIIEDLQWFINISDSSNFYRIEGDSYALTKIDELSKKLHL